MNEEQQSAALLAALRQVRDPGNGQDFVSTRRVRDVCIAGGVARFTVEPGYAARSQEAALRQALAEAALGVPGITGAEVQLAPLIARHAVQRGLKSLPSVKNIIAVASGKGGVGKSTVACNLALALAAEGARVGLLDADIYGPSVPLMMGVPDARPDSDGQTMEPVTAHGLALMSIGFLVGEGQAAIWRGPMASQALEQMLRQTRWDAAGEPLDYLVADLPPGTGDIQLTFGQRIALVGAVIVTTPQDIALADARRGVAMFEKVGVPVLGLAENMAVHVCQHCGHEEHIFGQHGGEKYAAEQGIPFLGALPLALQVREAGDAGCPVVAAAPHSAHARLYRAMALKVAAGIAVSARDYSARIPPVAVEQTR